MGSSVGVTDTGVVVVLNGVPRAGKSSIANALVETAAESWQIRGVDAAMATTDPALLPGIGLRPGGERPDLEPFVLASYHVLFDDVAATARSDVNVAMDVGLHDRYSQPLGIRAEMTRRLAGLHVVLVGVHCPLPILRERRRTTGYPTWNEADPVPAPIRLWQDAVHAGMNYDLEFDTSQTTPSACANLIAAHTEGLTLGAQM